MLQQPCVCRMFFNNEREAQAASKELDNLDVPNDYLSSSDNRGKWKSIFTAATPSAVSHTLKLLSVKSRHIDVFDPTSDVDWHDGLKPV